MAENPTIIINNDSNSGSGISSGLNRLIPERFYSILAIIIAISTVILLYIAYSSFVNYVDENCPDADGFGDIAFCAVEEETGVEDTGASAGSAFLSNLFWATPIGYLGAAVGIRTDGGTVGERLGNNFNRTKNNAWTVLNRLLGR